MKFTPKQLKDLETIEYFIPNALKNIKITDKDKEMFLENSEKGLHNGVSLVGKHIGFKEGIGSLYEHTGFQALMWGKIWRGRIVHEIFEPWLLDKKGWIGYMELVKNMPRNVVDFIKKEMFKGQDAEIIEKAYQEVLSSKKNA